MSAMRATFPVAAAAMVAMLLCNCKSSQGECSYDTDCVDPCSVCDAKRHVCVVDQTCVDKKDQKCTQDSDCDPVMEACVQGTCRRIGGGDPGQSDGDGWVKPDDPECNNADCSAKNLPNQGRDVDGDQWGRCCDCDDLDPKVNPDGHEVVYNCKDDDCSPDTRDDDLDNDGYGSNGRACNPGDDCDDRKPHVHPGAEEVCDGLDNDCNGSIDPPGSCPDGGVDGGDVPASCPSMAGHYIITSHCLNIDDGEADIVQQGCSVNFLIGGVQCTGTIDAALNFYVNCGIQFACQAKAKLTGSFTIECSANCTFDLMRSDQGAQCAYHNDPTCTSVGKICGITFQQGNPTNTCITPNPQGRQPGYFCSPNASIECVNSLCINNQYCGAICTDPMHCQVFPGTTCQDVMYSDGTSSGTIKVCVPDNQGETYCRRTPECSSARVCSYRQLDNAVITVCRPPNSGGALGGTACTQASQCENNMCVCGDRLCSTGTGSCADVCASGQDCIQCNMCGSVTIPDLQGQNRAVPACISDPSACCRDADCPYMKSCQIFIAPSGLELATQCDSAGNAEQPNTGVSCINHSQCYSAFCAFYPSYCVGCCISDADCPTFDQSPEKTCTRNDECDLGYLCLTSGKCQRKFECYTQIFLLGYTSGGVEITDTAQVCHPRRQNCSLNSDCRTGEVCTLYTNKTATSSVYQCEVGGPGSAELGADCASNPDICRGRLCITSTYGSGQQVSYCSQPCMVATDCGDPLEWSCVMMQVPLRDGYISFMPVCAKR